MSVIADAQLRFLEKMHNKELKHRNGHQLILEQ